MIEATRIKLSKEIVDTLSANQIIYAEIAQPGAMGNAGGVMIYTLKNKQLICYETDIFTDEKTYLAAEVLLLNQQVASHDKSLKAENMLLEYYPGGMGNSVFINKNNNLEIRDRYFSYNRNNREYHILSSLYVVFKNVVYALQNPED